MSVRVTLEDVRVVLGGSEILHGVSLELAAGEFLTLLGPSGSGKTTTLNVIAGLVPTTGGDVRFDDTSIVARPSHDRDIGMVFQSYALFPHMTVEQNIEFALHARRVPRGDRRGIDASSTAHGMTAGPPRAILDTCSTASSPTR